MNTRRIVILVAFQLAITVLALALIVIVLAPRFSAKPNKEDRQYELTAQEARLALIELARTNPSAFAARIDPQELSQSQVADMGGGRYSLGGISIDLNTKRFEYYVVTQDLKCAVGYVGSFTRQGGAWVAGRLK